MSIPYKVIAPNNTVLVSGSLVFNSRPVIHLPRLPSSGTYSLLVSPGLATFNAAVKLLADPIVALDGAPASIATEMAGQSARFVIDAAANQSVGVGVLGLSLAPTSSGSTAFSAFRPDGSAFPADLMFCFVADATNPQANCDGELAATAAGSYTLVAKPPLGSTMAFAVQASNEAVGVLAADAGSDVASTRVGQDLRYTYAASAGESIGVALTSITAQPKAHPVAVRVYKPDGTQWASGSVTPATGGYVEAGAAAAAGTYSVLLDAGYGAYGSARLTLKRGPPLLATDPPAAFAPATAGEAARFRFTAAAGQSVAVGVSSISANSNLTVYSPSGTQVSATSCLPGGAAGGRCKLTLTNLAGGTYSAVVWPTTAALVTGNASLSNDLTGTLAPGVAQTLSATREAQNARLTFAGTAGEVTSVKVWNVSTTPANQGVSVTVYRPDGGYLTSGSVSSGSLAIALPALPSTGNYTVLIEPSVGTPWQGSIALDPGATVAIDGAMPALASSLGEPLRFRFAGTAGQRAEIGIGGLGYASASTAATTLTLYRPDGSAYGSSISCYTSGGASCENTVASLPVTGTYTLTVLPPASPNLTSGSLAVSTPASGAFTIGAPAQLVEISRPGQTARFTFAGSTGQLLRLGWTSPAVGNASAVGVTVLGPSGSTVASASMTNGVSASLDIPALPATGTFTVVLDPAFGATLSAPVSLVVR